MRKHMTVVNILFLIFILAVGTVAKAQEEIVTRDLVRANCGDIIEGEFSVNHEQHQYLLNLSVGDEVDASIVAFGEQLKTAIFIQGPTGLVFAISDDPTGINSRGQYTRLRVESNPKVASGVLSARGNYTIIVNNYSWTGFLGDTGGIGAYNVFIGCTLRDGTRIEPGSEPPPDVVDSTPPTPSFTGYGFPGLPSVDFTSAFILPYTPGTPFPGQIPATGPGVIGFTLNAAANDTLDLKFDRTSGNLNLGVVVLFGQDQVLFYGGLIASNTLSTTLTLPSEGQYTIGVFRVDLLPPAAPEATAFQVLGTLNP